ncbi:hypothetical protein ACFX2J_027449 [Malus domestica]|nr:clathrin light chain 2-like [Malus domestica]
MASFTQPEDDSVPITVSTRPFDDDGYLGYDPRLPSQRFDSFVEAESLKDSATDSPIFHGSAAGDAFATQPASEAFSPPSIYAESNGQGFNGGFGGSDDPILPPPSEMLPDEGFALREWRRLVEIFLSLDRIGEVFLSLNSDGLSWKSLEPLENDDSIFLGNFSE